MDDATYGSSAVPPATVRLSGQPEHRVDKGSDVNKGNDWAEANGLVSEAADAIRSKA